jgi:NTP pyrophosphatase (non-canonical NTP hydrolase)
LVPPFTVAVIDEKPLPEKNPHMTFHLYQKQARKTAIYPNQGNNLPYPALGLSSETGEVADHVKKIIRDDNGTLTPQRKKALVKELGDVLWYLSAICDELKVSLNTVAKINLEKLQSRKTHGTLHGKGDNR